MCLGLHVTKWFIHVAPSEWSTCHDEGRPCVTPWWCHVSCGFGKIGQGSMGKMNATCRAIRATHVMPHIMPCVSLHGMPCGIRGFTNDSMGFNRSLDHHGFLLPRCDSNSDIPTIRCDVRGCHTTNLLWTHANA
jgi:hypothetical protein